MYTRSHRRPSRTRAGGDSRRHPPPSTRAASARDRRRQLSPCQLPCNESADSLPRGVQRNKGYPQPERGSQGATVLISGLPPAVKSLRTIGQGFAWRTRVTELALRADCGPEGGKESVTPTLSWRGGLTCAAVSTRTFCRAETLGA